MRIDKWLWSARFYKTRSLAAAAADGGKVRLNGMAAKPGREVKPGDRIELRAGGQHYEVVVCGLNPQRRPAPEARLLYEESAASVERRAREAELRALAPVPENAQSGRPTKRARRQIDRLRSG